MRMGSDWPLTTPHLGVLTNHAALAGSTEVDMQPMGDALQPGSFRLVYSLRQPWYTAVSLMLQSIAYWLHFRTCH